jgi:hypothetical protein
MQEKWSGICFENGLPSLSQIDRIRAACAKPGWSHP